MTYEREQVTIIAQRVRISELELQLADAVKLAEVARRELAAILAGCGSTEEQLRASVPVLALQRHLKACIERPEIADPVERLAVASVEIVPVTPATPAAEAAAIQSAYVERSGGKVIPLKRRTQFYEGLMQLEPRGDDK